MVSVKLVQGQSWGGICRLR